MDAESGRSLSVVDRPPQGLGRPRDQIPTSVVIPARGRVALLRHVLRRLDEEDSDFEILVVADGCLEVVEYVRRSSFRHQVRLFDTGGGSTLGVVVARNLGAQKARGDMLVFLDADCLVDPAYVATYRKHFTEKTLLIGSCDEVDEDNWDNVIRAERRVPFTRAVEDSLPLTRAALSYTSNIAVGREAFCRIGGFDMSFIDLGGSDCDFGLRFAHHFEQFEFIDNRVRHVGLSSGHGGVRTLDRSLYEQRVADGLYCAGSPLLIANGGPAFFEQERWSAFEDLRKTAWNPG